MQFDVLSSGRYRGLIISIFIFLLLIGMLLVYTFYASNQLEQNTALVNETNAVANDAQAVIKDLFDLQNSYGESIRSPHMKRVLSRLEENSKEISATLDTIAGGGVLTDAQGNSVVLPKITDEKSLKDLESAQTEWAKLKPKIDKYLQNATDITIDSSADLNLAVDQAKTSSLLINESLSDLVDDIFTVTENQANLIRTIQLMGIALILLYFAIFIFFFIRRLGESDSEAQSARQETQEIMQTVNTGLFLLDKDLNIGNQYSKALESILGTDRLAGQNFTSILRNRISDKDLETTRQFIEQLYNPRVKSKLVNDLNPLNKVMLNENDGTLGSDKYLDFTFSRVYENKDIARILVNVNDVSDAVRLEQRLEKEREQNDLQIEMLTTILNVSPKQINAFIKNTNSHIESINNVLKNPGSSQFELEAKLKSIYREMHSLKGEASALKLHSFTAIASDAEDKLHALQNQGKLSGNDFLPLAVNLDDLLNLSNTISTLGDRINQATSGAINFDSARQPEDLVDQIGSSSDNDNAAMLNMNQPATNNIQPSGQVNVPNTIDVANKVEVAPESEAKLSGEDVQAKVRYYQNIVEQVAERQEKEVRLVTSGFDLPVSEEIETALSEISIQLIRNAIVHGIEGSAVREDNGKDTVGTIKLLLKRQNDHVMLAVEDDGAGINYNSIKDKLVELGHYDVDQVQRLPKSKLLNALFSSGFSTKDSTDEDAGRGVGLDIIRDRVKSMNGKINVHSEAGKMSRFTIALPISG